MSKRPRSYAGHNKTPRRYRSYAVGRPVPTRNSYCSPERKYYDQSWNDENVSPITTIWGNSTIINTGASVPSLVLPRGGTDINQRIGNKIALQKLVVRFQMRTPISAIDGAVPASQTFRVLLVQNKQTNGIQCDAVDVLLSDGTDEPMLLCFQNVAKFGKFRILKDVTRTVTPKQMAFSSTTATRSAGTVYYGKFVVKFKQPVVVRFQADAGTIGDVMDNSFFIMAGCDQSSPNVRMSMKSRAYYTDA